MAAATVFFATSMVSLDEHRAGITVGTMSLIRRAALEAAGGWAAWCLTEDSELAIRIHAAGYQSVYLTEPYGRGGSMAGVGAGSARFSTSRLRPTPPRVGIRSTASGEQPPAVS